jgi:hypothetical protein
LSRPVQEEIQDAKVYKSKKGNLDLKKKIMPSLFKEEDEDSESEVETESKVDGEKAKEDKSKKPFVKATKHDNKTSIGESITDERLKAYGISNPNQFKRKLKYDQSSKNNKNKSSK